MADLCIMNEITKYKNESAELDFWTQHVDFFELGDDANLIREDKMKEEYLEPENRKEYILKRASSKIGTLWSPPYLSSFLLTLSSKTRMRSF